MAAPHVFVETNWVVDCCAPSHFRAPGAMSLLEKAKGGSLTIHVPGVCLSEGRNAIRKKFQPRYPLDPLRKYIRWASDDGRDDTTKIDGPTADTVRRLLERYEQFVSAELDNLEATVGDLRRISGIEIFPLSEVMLERSLTLTDEKLDLRPFDNSILAAILTRAEEIKTHDRNCKLFFCTLDGHLQPWDKAGNMKQALTRLYDEAHIWVYADFEMSSHERPADWPK